MLLNTSLLFFLLHISGFDGCHRAKKHSINKTQDEFNRITRKNKTIILPEKLCNIYDNRNKFQEPYCKHNSTCSYHLVPINYTHDKKEIMCICERVSIKYRALLP